MSNEEEKVIMCFIMDKTGDSQLAIAPNDAFITKHAKDEEYEDAELVTKDAAVDRIVSEMGGGKWLRLVDIDGKSDTITDVTNVRNKAADSSLFTNVSEVALMAALVGGSE